MHRWEAHVLEWLAKAEESMRILARKVDADGSFDEQARGDRIFAEADANFDAAMEILRRTAAGLPPAEGDGPPEAALEFLRELYSESVRDYLRAKASEANPTAKPATSSGANHATSDPEEILGSH